MVDGAFERRFAWWKGMDLCHFAVETIVKDLPGMKESGAAENGERKGSRGL